MLKLLLILFALYAARNLYLRIKNSSSLNTQQKSTPEKHSFKSQDAVDAEYKEVDPD